MLILWIATFAGTEKRGGFAGTEKVWELGWWKKGNQNVHGGIYGKLPTPDSGVPNKVIPKSFKVSSIEYQRNTEFSISNSQNYRVDWNTPTLCQWNSLILHTELEHFLLLLFSTGESTMMKMRQNDISLIHLLSQISLFSFASITNESQSKNISTMRMNIKIRTQIAFRIAECIESFEITFRICIQIEQKEREKNAKEAYQWQLACRLLSHLQCEKERGRGKKMKNCYLL